MGFEGYDGESDEESEEESDEGSDEENEEDYKGNTFKPIGSLATRQIEGSRSASTPRPRKRYNDTNKQLERMVDTISEVSEALIKSLKSEKNQVNISLTIRTLISIYVPDIFVFFVADSSRSSFVEARNFRYSASHGQRYDCKRKLQIWNPYILCIDLLNSPRSNFYRPCKH